MAKRRGKATSLNPKQIAIIVATVLGSNGVTGGAALWSGGANTERLEERLEAARDDIRELKAEITEINRRTQDIDRRTLTMASPSPREN